MRASRAAPWGADPPLGHVQHSLCDSASTSGRRLGPRTCLRRDCGRIYRPRRWNQRYCQEPECLKLVRRWQAAKRQEERRKQPEVRQAHAAAERQRRARRRVEGCCEASSKCGHMSEEGRDPCAWSRSKNFSGPFCDRPGCYDAVRPSCRCQARYCSDDCRQAVKRVRDRERKWLSRNTQAGRFKRHLEYGPERRKRRDGWPAAEADRDPPAGRSRWAGRQL